MVLKVALVHDWLVSQRGGEAVLETLVDLFPSAPIFTLVADRTKISDKLSACDIRTSFLQDLSGAGPTGFRKFLPLFPSAVAGWDFTGFDLIVSTSHCVAKAAGASQNIPHIYIHTPCVISGINGSIMRRPRLSYVRPPHRCGSPYSAGIVRQVSDRA